MNFAVNSATWGLNQILPLFNNGNLILYNNPQPATPETVLAGTNTALATFVFSATAFGAPAFGSPNDAATASFVASSVTPGANGTVTFARATLKVLEAWTASHTYSVLFSIVTNSNNYYILTKTGTAAASGGPSGTTNAVTDNSCQWAYYSATATQNNVLADFSVGTSGTDIIIGSTTVTTTVQVTMTSFVLQTTAS